MGFLLGQTLLPMPTPDIELQVPFLVSTLNYSYLETVINTVSRKVLPF